VPELPKLAGKKVILILERLGFAQVRQRGSHVILKRATPEGERGCVVPLHREVKSGTLQGILRQAGIAHDEFLRALK